ncbi:hypothetical protein N6H14_01525 [Paenibacillus sp. CC-CFT747]|nr:hypothetical protein N6H14_01525 [Paenibacillus sp. CC-CFT747]
MLDRNEMRERQVDEPDSLFFVFAGPFVSVRNHGNGIRLIVRHAGLLLHHK